MSMTGDVCTTVFNLNKCFGSYTKVSDCVIMLKQMSIVYFLIVTKKSSTFTRVNKLIQVKNSEALPSHISYHFITRIKSAVIINKGKTSPAAVELSWGVNGSHSLGAHSRYQFNVSNSAHKDIHCCTCWGY